MGWLLDSVTWRPRIGDPNPVAIVVTVGYFVAFWLCLSAARRLKNTSQPQASFGPERFWISLTLLMFVLGWNKQLDLQTLLTQVCRAIARHDGWYSHRRMVQGTFVLCCAIAGCGVLISGLRLMRGNWRQFGLAFSGAVYLVTFIVIRAASFYHVDVLLYHLPMVGNWVSSGLELVGIGLVIIGAWSATREPSIAVDDSIPGRLT